MYNWLSQWVKQKNKTLTKLNWREKFVYWTVRLSCTMQFWSCLSFTAAAKDVICASHGGVYDSRQERLFHFVVKVKLS